MRDEINNKFKELRKQKKAFEKKYMPIVKVPNTSLEIKKEAEELYETYGETKKLFDKYKFKCIVPLVSEDFYYYRKIDIDKIFVISLSPPSGNEDEWGIPQSIDARNKKFLNDKKLRNEHIKKRFDDRNHISSGHLEDDFRKLVKTINDDDHPLESCYEDILETIDLELFQPDVWKNNRCEVEPIVVPDDVRFTKEIETLLIQAYAAYTYGLYAACIALTRAILEQALKDCSQKYCHDEEELKGLSLIIDKAAAGNSDLNHKKNKMHEIRKAGNHILHSTEQNVGKIMPTNSYKFLKDLNEILFVLYKK